MFRGIVFDLDHTLFDRYATLKKALPVFYNHYRSKIPDDIGQDEFIERLIELEKKYIHYDWVRVFAECSNQGLMAALNDEEIAEAKQFLFNECWAVAAVKFPFSKPTLELLKQMGYKLGLITNGSHQVQMKKIKMLELENSFDEIVITGDIGAYKPDVLPFSIMSEKLGIAPCELMYVGDHPLNDVEGSRKAGYTPVWLNATGYWSYTEIARAPYEIDRVDQLPELLKNII